MKKVLALIAVMCISGCANTPVGCYAEAGIGAWTKTTDRARNVGLIGETPTDLNMYCEKGNVSFGYYHTSDVGRGWPFNDQKEWSADKVMIHYRVKIY